VGKRNRGPIVESNSKPKVHISARNPEQKDVLKTIASHDISFVKGMAGTGKTYIAIGYALQELYKGNYDKVVISRPAVEAGGEKLGFLPGGIDNKMHPYMLPVLEAMSQLLPDKEVKRLTSRNGMEPIVRVLPLAFMRGTTFINACIVLDEMQNSMPEQMRMVLTRFGEGSKMIICGDVKQSDIRQRNGLEHAFSILSDISEIGFCTLTENAIVRHPIIKPIEEKYDHDTV